MGCFWCTSLWLPACSAGSPCVCHFTSSSNAQRLYMQHTSWNISEKVSERLCLIMKNWFLYSVWLFAGWNFCSDLSNIVFTFSLSVTEKLRLSNTLSPVAPKQSYNKAIWLSLSVFLLALKFPCASSFQLINAASLHDASQLNLTSTKTGARQQVYCS